MGAALSPRAYPLEFSLLACPTLMLARSKTPARSAPCTVAAALRKLGHLPANECCQADEPP